MPPVLFIHGAWVTPACWESFRRVFEAADFETHAPAWPFVPDRPNARLRSHPDPRLGRLAIGQITDAYASFAATLKEPPILVGHSFGGLVVQKLLDRGIGAAGVAINPAPIAGIIPDFRSLLTVTPILARWAGWRRSYLLSPARFAALFTNTLTPQRAGAAYDAQIIPAPGMIFYQAALWTGTGVDPVRRRAPLLITGASADRTVTPHAARAAYRKQRRSPAPTDFIEFTGKSHLLIAEPGWEEVAGPIRAWIEALPAHREGSADHTRPAPVAAQPSGETA